MTGSDPLTIAANAAHGFQVLQCQECAENIRDALVAAGHAGQIIELRVGGTIPYMVCLSYQGEQTTITQNGRHVGVRVGDTVFDNLHPNGMQYDQWLQDFDAHLGVVVASVMNF